MAQIQSESIVITVSKLVKAGEGSEGIEIPEEVLASLEAVAQELLGQQFVIEVVQA